MNKVFVLFLILTGFSCTKKLKISEVPKISYISMYPNRVLSGATEGKTTISLYFEDGNGDIGFGAGNLFFKDSRDGNIIPFSIPEIPAEYSPDKGMKGVITVDYKSALLYTRPDTSHLTADTLYWEIFMKDKAGNQSNTVETETLYLYK